ncbi:unnamed protein product, partial [Amoebophrya sp. A120]
DLLLNFHNSELNSPIRSLSEVYRGNTGESEVVVVPAGGVRSRHDVEERTSSSRSGR